MKNKKQPSQSFGPAFPKWLSTAEYFEDYVGGKTKRFKNPTDLSLQKDLFKFEAGDHVTDYPEVINLWSENAAKLRNSFKFDLGHLTAPLIKEKDYIVTTYLPFQTLYFQHLIVFKKDGVEMTAMYLCERKTVSEGDNILGLSAGETYISIQLSTLYNKSIVLDPVEIRLREGIDWCVMRHEETKSSDELSVKTVPYPDKDQEEMVFSLGTPPNVNASGFVKNSMQLWAIGRFCAFLALLNQNNVKQSLRGKVKPGNVLRRKPTHKKQHPMYEYRVLELDVNPEPDTAVNIQMPRETPKKRLHAVRGFLRHYKQPLKTGPNAGKSTVFVKEHWRGEKDLGVIRKDYAVLT